MAHEEAELQSLAKRETYFTNWTVSSFLTFGLIFLIFYQLNRSKKSKKLKVNALNWNSEWDLLPGLETIPSIKSSIPLKLIGILPKLFPLNRSIQTLFNFAKERGEIFKFDILNETFVVFNSGPLCQTILRSTDDGHNVKSPLVYNLMRTIMGNGILVSTGKLWHSERKILMKSQSYQSLKAYMPMLNKNCQSFVASVNNLFKDGLPHQINELINSSFIKIIIEMITGVTDDSCTQYTKYHHNFQIWKETSTKRVVSPWLLFNPIFKLHPIARKYDMALEELFEFARTKIKENRTARAETSENIDDGIDTSGNSINENGGNGTTAKFRSILDDLLDAGLDDRQIIDEFNTIMFGGHETGASAIHCFLFFMALHPEIQKECQREIDELFENPLFFKNGQLTYDAVSNNLKYVERCISETMRLFPPVFMYFRKLGTPLKIQHNRQDCVIPKGTNVVICPYSLHRVPEYYPEPEKFDPDRFLPDEAAKRHSYSFLPFSAGPRNCLGLKFANLEMKIIAAYTLRSFTFKTDDRMEDIPMLPYITLTPERDYTFKCTKRNEVNMS